MSDQASTRKATRREWVGLAVIALPCMLYSMDMTVLNLAVPHLSAALKPTSSQLLWIVDIYGFLIAGALITMGTLGDRIGRRKLLLIGAAFFGLASVLAAFASTPETLILARAIQGLAAATLAPSTLSLISNMFPDSQERTFAIGMWIASFSAGAAIGPLIGGALLEQFWWGSVFLINVPVMVLLLAVAPVLLPEYRDPQAGRLDLVSAALSLVAVLAVIFGLKRFAEHGAGWLPLAAVLAGLAIGFVFARRQMVLKDPLIPLGLFRSPAFSGSLAINVIGFFAMFGSFLAIGQYMQLVLGMGPLEAGLWGLPSSAGFILGSVFAPRMVRGRRPAYVIAAGFSVVALGFLAMSLAETYGLAALVPGFMLMSFGLSPVVTLTTDLVVGSVPPERAGIASGMSETSTELGGAVGVAVLGSLATVIYRNAMVAGVPEGLPPAAAEAARDTLGGAVAVAAGLPAEAAAQLLHTAREAFALGFEVSVTMAAALALAAALLAAALLRGVAARPVEAPAAPPCAQTADAC